MWEGLVEDKLGDSDFSAFDSIGKCKIKLIVDKTESQAVNKSNALAVEEDEIVTGQRYPVNIQVICRNVNWKRLTAKEERFSAQVLMQQYNKVHQVTDGGDKYLQKLRWKGSRASTVSQSLRSA